MSDDIENIPPKYLAQLFSGKHYLYEFFKELGASINDVEWNLAEKTVEIVKEIPKTESTTSNENLIKLLTDEDIRKFNEIRKTNRVTIDLRGRNFSYKSLREANLEGADLREADLQGANLEGADLREADLREANLEGANLIRANLREAHLIRAYLVRAYLVRAYLEGANLEGANLREANLEGANLIRANLIRANLVRANLRNVQNLGFSLDEAKQRGAVI